MVTNSREPLREARWAVVKAAGRVRAGPPEIHFPNARTGQLPRPRLTGGGCGGDLRVVLPE
jgi:hypothetical protein